MSLNVCVESSLAQIVRTGQYEFYHSSVQRNTLPQAKFEERGLTQLYSSGINCVHCNGVFEKDEARVHSEEEIFSVVEFFSAQKLPFIWWSSDRTLENKGLEFAGYLGGVVLDITEKVPPKPIVSSNVEIKIVRTLEELNTFTFLAAKIFGLEPREAELWLLVNKGLMEHKEQIHFLALLDEVPVGTVSLSTCDSSAGIWNLTIMPEYRKSGIGSALVHAAILEGKSLQYTHIMGTLLPRGLARGIADRLGFQEACKLPFYIHGISLQELEK